MLKLSPQVTMRHLGLVALADSRGRNPAASDPLTIFSEEFDNFMKEAEKAEVLERPEAPVLLGRHLLDVIPPGPEMGNARRLHRAFNAVKHFQ